MSQADTPALLSAASAFLLQAPPGELNDVYTDLRALIAPLLPGGEPALEAALVPALRRYAEEQLTVVDLPGAGAKALITPASRLEGDDDERHVEPRSATSFAWDAVAATASDPVALSTAPDAETASLRDALDALLSKYTENHYASGVSAVFALPDPAYAVPAPAPAEPEQAETRREEEKEVADVAAETAQAVTEALPADSVESANGEEEAPADAEGTAGGEAAREREGESEEMDVEPETPTAPEGGADSAAAAAEPTEAVSAQEETPIEEATPKQARPTRLFALYLVGNKYNPSNYWTGRWRSTYQLDHAKGTLEGTAQINIHYYEQGNVQLSTTLKSSTVLSASPAAEAVVAALKASESSFQRQLGETYATLSDASFKGLRRALPKTRSKIDWDKAGTYKLGQQIGGAQ
ncbi:hypothetical protein JCM3770_003999 [Rhodotorula araucariae]